jgi:signal transduction histidine kinase/ActR/RegA family two-component response regulator
MERNLSDAIAPPEKQKIPTAKKELRGIPLRLVLILPFVVQIVGAVGLVGYLSFKNGQQAVNELVDRLMDKNTDLVSERLNSYLKAPQRLNQINLDAIALGLLDLKDFKTAGRHFWKQSQLYPDITYISYALTTGEYAGAGRFLEGGGITIDELSSATNWKGYTYATDSQGNRTKLAEVYPSYKPLTEAWYKDAVRAGKPVWGRVYNWTGESLAQYLSINAASPIYDAQARLVGVIGVDLLLAKISEFLRQLKISPTAKTFIIERDGLLIGSSSAEKPFTLVDGVAKRLGALNSSDPQIREAAEYLQQKFGGFERIKDEQRIIFPVQGKNQFVRVTPWKDEYGLDWLVVTTIPESDFMEQINANTRTSIILCLGALVLAVILAWITSRWIVEPILRLKRASQAIARGELDRPVEVKNINELQALAQSFNLMAAQLKTSFTELEERVAERTIDLKTAKEAADRANQAKSEFLANMSHELRTPLNGILGYAQILHRSPALPEKERHDVAIIQECGSHLLTLINDILDLAKIEARKLELVPTAIHFPSFLQGIVEICRLRTEQKGIDFIYDVNPNLPVGITVDEKRLRQVLLNLLGNAIKFTDKGAVTLKVEVLTARPAAVLIRFQIKDTGVGIAPEEQDKIFHAFEQVGDRQRRPEGTGLGLAISQQIVQLMGGAIEVQSQLRKGSNFSFTVELALALDWVKQNATDSRKRIVGYRGDRQRILVIDDHWENRSVLVNLLEPLGFVMGEAENGLEGMEKLQQQPPELVILDLVMPVMDGFEFLRQVRRSQEFKKLKVIVSSASVGERERQMALAAGGDDFLPKPIDSNSLFHLIATHLRLDWRYEIVAADESNPPSQEVIVPPPEDLNTLLELSHYADLKQLRQEIEALVRADDRYQGFAAPILQLAQQFKVEEIEDLLQQYLAGENGNRTGL